jgi:hypothetical protein
MKAYGERAPDTHWIGGWVDPRVGLDDVEKRKFLTLPGLELRLLGRPARNQSLYRLGYPGSRNLYGNLQIYEDKQLYRKDNKYIHAVWSRVGSAGTVIRLRTRQQKNLSLIPDGGSRV